MRPFRQRLRATGRAVREAARVTAILYGVYCIPFALAVVMMGVRGSLDWGLLGTFLLLAVPIWGGFVLVALVLTPLGLLGAPVERLVPRPEDLPAPFRRKPVASASPPAPFLKSSPLYDRDLDG